MFAKELVGKIIWIVRDKLQHVCTSHFPLRHKYDPKKVTHFRGKNLKLEMVYLCFFMRLGEFEGFNAHSSKL